MTGTRRSQYGEVAEAIFLTQGFVYDSAEQAEARFVEAGEDEFIYARYGNPTVRMFEDRIAALEGTEDAFATASGMAAVNGALTSMLKAGDHVVSARALFGSCLYVLEDVLGRFGVEVTFVDGTDLDAWRAARPPGHQARCSSKAISNPTLEVVDIAGVAEIAHARRRAWSSSTTSSPRRSSRARSSWAPMWWSIPRPSISTARAGRWAA